MTKAYVVGAGLAGLSAAVALAGKGVAVDLIEAAGQAGGRCRSYHDAALDQVIDNGNHLVLSGNRAVFSYLGAIGSAHALSGPKDAHFAFVDVRSGARWTIGLNDGPLPWWVFARGRRVPGTVPADYARMAALLWARRGTAVADTVACKGRVWDRLMRPFLLAALNTAPEISSAALAGTVMRETLAKGGRACRPCIAHPTLAAAFVDPALAYLAKKGASVGFGRRLRRIVFDGARATALEFPEATVPLAPEDRVVLAVPSWVAQELVPGLVAPQEFSAIVNAHFKLAPPRDAPGMLGVIGGTAEWIFALPGRISVTVSGADALAERDREEIVRLIWADVQTALGIVADLPPWQIVKEKRATFAATPEQNARRPGARTGLRNLVLAGDWTDTGLPATLEGAIRSGQKAARLARAAADV